MKKVGIVLLFCAMSFQGSAFGFLSSTRYAQSKIKMSKSKLAKNKDFIKTLGSISFEMFSKMYSLLAADFIKLG